MSQDDVSGHKRYLYLKIITYLEGIIHSNPQKGKKLPSVREICKIFHVSPPTVVKAYSELEAKGLISAVAKTGYFVDRAERCSMLDPDRNLLSSIYRNSRMPGIIPLSIDAAANSSGFWKLMQKKLKREGSFDNCDVKNYSLEGENRLRAAIAHLYTHKAISWSYEEVLIVNSYHLALISVLKTVSNSTHVIVEAPCSWSILEMLEISGLIPIEVDLEKTWPESKFRLYEAIKEHKITSAILPATINPITGLFPPVEHRKSLLDLLCNEKITIIENNVYGELTFDEDREPVRLSYPLELLICVGSFSKTVSPSFGIGYILTQTRNNEVLSFIQYAPNTISANIQETLAQLIVDGSYHLAVRQQAENLHNYMNKMVSLLEKYIPRGQICYRKPDGGAVIWIRITNGADSIDLYNALIAKGITIAPGYIFSSTALYANYFRLSFATDWSKDITKATYELGKQIARLGYKIYTVEPEDGKV